MGVMYRDKVVGDGEGVAIRGREEVDRTQPSDRCPAQLVDHHLLWET